MTLEELVAEVEKEGDIQNIAAVAFLCFVEDRNDLCEQLGFDYKNTRLSIDAWLRLSECPRYVNYRKRLHGVA